MTQILKKYMSVYRFEYVHMSVSNRYRYKSNIKEMQIQYKFNSDIRRKLAYIVKFHTMH